MIDTEFQVMFAIEMLIISARGKVYTHKEINNKLINTGFNKIQRLDSISVSATLYIVHK